MPQDDIDGWSVVQTLGRGNFATTYLVERANEQFALKLCAGTSQSHERLSLEEESLKAFNHANIPKFISRGVFEGEPYMVMSLAKGETLQAIVADHERDGSLHGDISTMTIISQLLSAVAHIHERGRVHRDIKDANIIATPSGSAVTLIDFGFCKPQGVTKMRTDDSFWRVGAARFSPLAKLENPGPAIASHDVFAVGVVGYRLLTGSYPWQVSNEDDVGALKDAQRRQRLAPVAERNSYVYPAVSSFISRLLVIDDSQRPTAVEALREAGEFLKKVHATGAKLQRGETRLSYPHVIRDPVHGDIRMTNYEYDVLKTGEIQRLRYIKQLGFTNLVYPGAEHSRLSHSIGCLSRVEQALRTIEDVEGVRIDDDVRLRARLYALTHDVTHLPFGHTIEDELAFFPRHDKNSKRTDRLTGPQSELGAALRQNEIGRATLEQLDPENERAQDNIVSDVVSGDMGADVLDYVDRDSYFCGLDHRIDSAIFRHFRLQSIPATSDHRLVSLIGSKHGLRIDRQFAIESILAERYALFLKVYTNKVKNAASALLAKALSRAIEPKRGKLKEEHIEWLGDETLIDRLRSSGNDEVSRCAEQIHRRHLPQPVYRGFLLEKDRQHEGGYEDRQSWYRREGLGTPEGRAELEVAIARHAKVEPIQVMIHCPQKAPGHQRVSHLVAGSSRSGVPSQLSSGADIAAKHLALWELWVYVADIADGPTRGLVASTAQTRFGMPNVIDVDPRDDRLF